MSFLQLVRLFYFIGLPKKVCYQSVGNKFVKYIGVVIAKLAPNYENATKGSNKAFQMDSIYNIIQVLQCSELFYWRIDDTY